MVGNKFTTLSEVVFPIECFTADFSQFLMEKRQRLVFEWTTGYSESNPSISGIFLKFPNFLRSSVLNRLVVCEVTRTGAE